MTRLVPTPAPRPTRKLPLLAMVLMSTGGILIFLFLWNIAVGMQESNMPRPKGGTWEQTAVP